MSTKKGGEGSNSLAIEYRLTASLAPQETNPRTHSKAQIRKIAKSIKHFGWVNPIITAENGKLLCGHARLEAAKLLGLREVPTVCVTGMTEADKRAYILADNALAQKAGWDVGLLKSEFEFLLSPELNFDIDLTGFEMSEIDGIVFDAPSDTAAQEEVVSEPDPDAPVVSMVGDLWTIGQHKLFCGDARDPESYAILLGDKKAELVITDPPYNVPIAGHVSGLGAITHREFAMASGEMTKEQFIGFLSAVMQQLVAFAISGSIHMLFMDWRHIGELLTAGEAHYAELKNLCVWAKTNGGMGTFYRSQHELVFVFKAGDAPHINNFGLGDKGRYRTNLWTYPGVNSFQKGRNDQLAAHPTCKPVALLVDAILDCSNRNAIVLDVFAGSGSTLVAAERTGRRGFGIELDPTYVDYIVARLEKETGLQAKLHDGRSFAEVAAERTSYAEAAE